MPSKAESHSSIFGIAWNSVLALMIVLLVLIAVILFIVFTAQSAQGQTCRTIDSSIAGAERANPVAGLTMDEAKDLYACIPNCKAANPG